MPLASDRPAPPRRSPTFVVSCYRTRQLAVVETVSRVVEAELSERGYNLADEPDAS